MSVLVVTSINVEGYTKTKAEVIASHCSGNDIICMQETHLGLKSNRPTLPGMKLVAEIRSSQSFNSCRWRKGYNPDLCFISKRLAHLSEKAVLNPLPKSQHRPISITIKPAITKTEVPFRRRFNLQKAKWTEYSEGMERALLDVEPTPDNYTMFVQAVKKTACACIPRGCRKEYIAGLTEESLQLLESYETEFGNDPFSDTTSELGDALTESLGRERRKAWQDLIENINMTQNSKKAWSTIRKLNGDKITPPSVSDITPNQVGSQLVANGRRAETRRAKGEHHSTVIPGNQQNMSILTKPFTSEEFEAGLNTMKLGKAAGPDDILTEMITHLGPVAKQWFLNMYNTCLLTQRIPSIWRKAIITALLKPGKDPNLSKSYRPISLLCTTYKLFERLLLSRLSPQIDAELIKKIKPDSDPGSHAQANC
ncbi:hypothetical protein AAFF_G00148190 [Aldrovandia affinis]|uniref:Uncharacterized protein n=1 Tax=Aldrovandia affinis TaxID=143900 RepID=A0AAD7RPH9_9TELE|nr:hypothetical protein AAFF_G00148190 [Aldrovandia affinis]